MLILVNIYGKGEKVIEDITSNYTKNTGQSYGSVGGKIQIDNSNQYEYVKAPIDDVSYATLVAPQTSIPSSLIQYVDENDTILKLDVTNAPKTIIKYDIQRIEGATHVYVSSATGYLGLYK